MGAVTHSGLRASVGPWAVEWILWLWGLWWILWS